jgi:hypothetical protein
MDGMSAMSDAPPISAARPRWQFGLPTLLEAFVGLSIGAALVAVGDAAGLWLVAFLGSLLLLGLRCARATSRGQRMDRGIVLGLVFAVWLAAAFLVPTYSRAGPESWRSTCGNSIRQIALALHNYHDQYGSFPPPYVLGPDGTLWHSWRALILPYLAYAPKFTGPYRFDEPWNGPNNSRLAAQAHHPFACPADGSLKPGATSFYFVVGPERQPPGTSVLRLDDVTDPHDETILLVESDTVGANWLEPRDLTVEEALAGADPIEPRASPRISSRHTDSSGLRRWHLGNNVATVDGRVLRLPDDVDRTLLESLLTIDGGEDVDLPLVTEHRSRPAEILWLLLAGAIYDVAMVWRHWRRIEQPPDGPVAPTEIADTAIPRSDET